MTELQKCSLEITEATATRRLTNRRGVAEVERRLFDLQREYKSLLELPASTTMFIFPPVILLGYRLKIIRWRTYLPKPLQ